jgi:hypothetical protein
MLVHEEDFVEIELKEIHDKDHVYEEDEGL